MNDLLERACVEEYAATCAYLAQHPRARNTTRHCAFCRLRVEDAMGLRTHGGVFCTRECVDDWLLRIGCCEVAP